MGLDQESGALPGNTLTDAQVKTAYENNTNTNAFTDDEQTKLAGIEDGATADQTGAQIAAAYEAEANVNRFTDDDHSKLDGIEDGATADQTGAQIKGKYEAEADTNAFTDAEQAQVLAHDSGKEVAGAYTVLAADPLYLSWTPSTSPQTLTLLPTGKTQWVFNASDTYEGTLSESMGTIPPLGWAFVFWNGSAYVRPN